VNRVRDALNVSARQWTAPPHGFSLGKRSKSLSRARLFEQMMHAPEHFTGLWAGSPSERASLRFFNASRIMECSGTTVPTAMSDPWGLLQEKTPHRGDAGLVFGRSDYAFLAAE
jgi:hypothetical protein